MDNDSLSLAWLACARAVHFAACMLVLGVFVFDRFIAAPVGGPEPLFVRHAWGKISRRLLWIALPAVFISGVAWFALVTIDISGLPPSEALRMKMLGRVLNKTHFGTLWQWRSLFFMGTAIAAMPFLRGVSIWIAILCSASLCGSLAWTGHGQMGNYPHVHLIADVSHLLICGFWPMGLLPFALLFYKMRRTPGPDPWWALSVITRRFSAMSLASVAILSGTGLVNGWFLVGSFANLLGTTYGKVLLLKIVVFFVMVMIGAVNLLRLKPRISVDLSNGISTDGESAASRLQINVILELILAAIVIGVVGVLGMLMPANCGM